jgi:hypothetical protein
VKDGNLDPCEICSTPTATSYGVNFDGVHQNCPRCGEFKISGSGCSIMRQAMGHRRRALLSGWVHQQNESGSVPIITADVIKSVLQRSIPSVSDRANSLLKEAERGLEGLGGTFNINDLRFISATYSDGQADVGYLVSALMDAGLIKAHGAGGLFAITPAGHMKLDESRSRPSVSSQGFVAMWFDGKLNDAYENGFQVGVMNAGYNPLRIDKVEHVNRIDDEIIRQINASRFIVADFTGHRGGVYFEAGYALGINIPVFWTCQKEDMGALHFDIRQFNCIDWTTPQDLSMRLTARIEAVLGHGPLTPAN